MMTALVLTGTVAFANNAMAVTSLNTSRSNIYKSINASDQNAVAACKKGGGTVGKDLQGKDSCITCPPRQKMTENGCK
jgi:hypothetical protein